jgi:hypothetical protein
MMNRRSFLALVAAIPFASAAAPLPVWTPATRAPVWSDLRKFQPANQQLVTVYQVTFTRPEWPDRLWGQLVMADHQVAAAVVALLPLKFQNLRASFGTVAHEQGKDSPAFRAQLHALLDPYCAGVLA